MGTTHISIICHRWKYLSDFTSISRSQAFKQVTPNYILKRTYKLVNVIESLTLVSLNSSYYKSKHNTMQKSSFSRDQEKFPIKNLEKIVITLVSEIVFI